MRSAEIDAWVQRIARATREGQQNEDSRVELKTGWPSHEEAAWRLGGHANAARGETILWVIGLGPDGSVSPPALNELANWWPQVCKHFDDGVAPTMRDVVVHLDDGPVVALVFDTEAAPFVIKGGRHNYEVPFREGTRCGGARRRHLTRLLAPSAALPTFETLFCDGRLDKGGPNADKRLDIDWLVFATPVSIKHPFFIVLHRSFFTFSYEDGTLIADHEQLQFDQWTEITNGTLMVNTPRQIRIRGVCELASPLPRRDQHVRGRLTLGIAGTEQPIVLQQPLRPLPSESGWSGGPMALDGAT